jgi:hypothetical protein
MNKTNRRILSSLTVGLMIAGVACGNGRSAAKDTTLATDLSLAAQQRGSLDSLGDTARSLASNKRATTASRASSSDVSHTRRSASTSSSTARPASSGGTVEKHTKRDAAIGAAAGAVLGAATSKNKVKGGLIGGVVGGVLGGVIGNNVDKTKKP